jgi:hypothetical protein
MVYSPSKTIYKSKSSSQVGIRILLPVRKEIKCGLRSSFVAFLFDLAYSAPIDGRSNYGCLLHLSYRYM